mmetsp:Transcript_3488/g.14065  ORF Transcript_3488/g.14065 Transcript_3488/m.14065 type:complete len:393 (+) Transcript_3488:2038-3216(+)
MSPRPLARSSAMPMSPTSVRNVSGHPHAAMFSMHRAGGKNSRAVRSNPGARVAATALFPNRRSRCSSPEAAASSQPKRMVSTVHASSNIMCATRLSSASHSTARRALRAARSSGSSSLERDELRETSEAFPSRARRASLADRRLPPSVLVLAGVSARLVPGAPSLSAPLPRAKGKSDRNRPARPVAPAAASSWRPLALAGTLLVSSRNIIASSTTTGLLSRMKNIVPPAGSRSSPESTSSSACDSRRRRKGRTSSWPSMCVAGMLAMVRAEPNSDLRRWRHRDQADHSPSKDDNVRNISVASGTSACDHCTSLGSELSSTGVDATTHSPLMFRSVVCVTLGRKPPIDDNSEAERQTHTRPGRAARARTDPDHTRTLPIRAGLKSRRSRFHPA